MSSSNCKHKGNMQVKIRDLKYCTANLLAIESDGSHRFVAAFTCKTDGSKLSFFGNSNILTLLGEIIGDASHPQICPVKVSYENYAPRRKAFARMFEF